MSIKLIGAILIISGCGGLGFKISSAQVRQECSLRNLIGILDYMACELQYRLTPLPTLCRQVAAEADGVLQNVFLALTHELEDQISPDADRCMTAALSKIKNIPPITADALQMLGRSLGRFDLDGQLKGLEGVRQACRRSLESLNNNRDVRLRSYKTLGLCAGAAIAILFI